jgi:transposase
MSESSGIDSLIWGAEMPKAYSGDLRERVIEAVEAGASRHEAAECFEVSVASAVKWLQRWNKERSAAPKPRGGSVSPLEVFASEILAVVAEQPDLTLDETLVELRKRRSGRIEARIGLRMMPTFPRSPLSVGSRTGAPV